MNELKHPRPPYSKDHWLFRSTLAVSRDPLGFMIKHFKETGDLYRVDTFVRPVVVVTRAEHARYILQEHHREFEKSFEYDLLKLVLGNGLLSSDGDFWLRQRRLAQPAFHRKKIEALAGTMLEEANDMAARWRAVKSRGESLDLGAEMMAVTMRIAARTLFGADLEDRIGKVSESVTVLNEWLAARVRNPFLPPRWVPTPTNMRVRKASAELDAVIYDMIAERRRAADAESRDDLLSLLLAARDEDTGETMSDLQLRDEVITLFIAGHETTANALTWLLVLLARHPEVTDQLQEEIRHADLSGPPFAWAPHLPYTRRVIDEGLRLYPPAWVVGRKSMKAHEIGGYHIKEGMNVIACTYLIHRHPEYWDDPETFDPDRFLPERIKDLPKFAYFPFGGGPRLCIGYQFALMEMQIILAVLAKEFRFLYDKPEMPEPEPLVTLRPKGAVQIRLG